MDDNNFIVDEIVKALNLNPYYLGFFIGLIKKWKLNNNDYYIDLLLDQMKKQSELNYQYFSKG